MLEVMTKRDFDAIAKVLYTIRQTPIEYGGSSWCLLMWVENLLVGYLNTYLRFDEERFRNAANLTGTVTYV